MAGKAYLALTGRQTDEDGMETVTESHAPADYYEKDGSRYILYEEQQEDTGAVTKNTIKLKGPVLEMMKRGAIRSHMIFEAGRTHRADYATPSGTLRMEVSTQTLEARVRDGRVDIRLAYLLTSEGRFLSRCSLLLSLDIL